MTWDRPRGLIVEDDPAWQQILTELLRDEGLVVDVAQSLATALPLMRAVTHRIAVVDLSLQGNDPHNDDGLRVLDALKRHDPTCAPIMLSGYATVELAVDALRYRGAHTCLRKEGFRRADFRSLLRELLATAPLVTPPSPRASMPEESVSFDAFEGPVRGDALVVEDDAGWLGIYAELLGEAGYRCHVSRSYGEAVGLLRRHDYSLAVIDLSLASSHLPHANVDGLQILKHCQESRIPAIVVSGVASTSQIDRLFHEYQAFAFLEKQAFNRVSFLQVVNQVGSRTGDHLAIARLTEREREVAGLLMQGMTNKQIALELVISPNTVKRHVKSIFEKLGVTTRAGAVSALHQGS